MSRLRAAVATGLAGVVLGLLAGSLGAQTGESRAGLVVRFESGAVTEACVDLPEGGLTGLELLEAAGLQAVAEVSALGSTVCAIDGEGCDFPGEPCWCQCQNLGEDCTYWAYHVLRDGAWRYSQIGAGARRLEPGDVDGWAWGPGLPGSGAKPPLRTFDDVCGRQAGPATETPTATPLTPPTPTAAAPATRSSAPTRTRPPSRDDDEPGSESGATATQVPSETVDVRETAAAGPAAGQGRRATNQADRQTQTHVAWARRQTSVAATLDAVATELARAFGANQTPAASDASGLTEPGSAGHSGRLGLGETPRSVDPTTRNRPTLVNLDDRGRLGTDPDGLASQSEPATAGDPVADAESARPSSAGGPGSLIGYGLLGAVAIGLLALIGLGIRRRRT